MRRLGVVLFVALLVIWMAALPGPIWAMPGQRFPMQPFHGFHGFHHFNHFHHFDHFHHFHHGGPVFFGSVGVFATVPFGYPGYTYPVYPYPAYAPPPPSYAPAPPAYWYYCQNPPGYYPYVPQCPGGWMTVLPPSTAP